jgi:hypothetical protein
MLISPPLRTALGDILPAIERACKPQAPVADQIRLYGPISGTDGAARGFPDSVLSSHKDPP